MAVDKLVDSAQLDADLTSVANAIRAKGSTSASLAFPSGFVDAIDAIETGGGGGDAWQRPSDWPDYSKLRLAENETEAIFFTYDNRNPPTVYGIDCWDTVYDRVQIESDGSVTVLESGIAQSGNLTSEMGDYVCIRGTPKSGKHITGVNMSGSGSSANYLTRQRCLERYGYLPYCSLLGQGVTYRDWGNAWVQSDTFLKTADTITRVSYAGSFGASVSLKNLDIRGNPLLSTYVSFAGVNLKQLPNVRIKPSSTNNANPLVFDNSAFESLDLSNVDYSEVVGNSRTYPGGFSNCKNLKWVRMPTNMDSMTNGIYDTFNGCSRLERVEFDATYSSAFDVRVFSGCFNMQALILRSTTIVDLQSVNSVDSFLVTNGGHVYVPSSVLDSYKSATNWSTFADFILPIEGSYWETHHADGSLIE